MRLVSATVTLSLLLFACSEKKTIPSEGDELPLWGSASAAVAPRPGMVWVPPGTLLAGTPKDRVPRMPDAELAGDPFELEGFYIDIYPHPNEAGAIPTTNLTREDAQKLCVTAGKRLCTEVEVERACKGPANHAYPYGDAYRHDVCATGKKGDSLTPNGFHTSCVSEFGVHDTHGTVWVWTSSEFARGTEGMGVLKGGNLAHGELVGRCAHVKPQKPETAAANVGVRCCLGPINEVKVSLAVTRDKTLSYRRDDYVMQRKFEESIQALPDLVEGEIILKKDAEPGVGPKAFHVERVWEWHPLGNEELFVAGGCSQTSRGKICGVFVGREVAGSIRLLLFAGSDKWQPTLSEGDETRILYVMGGDDYGAFRKPVAWEWGRVQAYPKERKKGKSRWAP